MNLMRLFSHAKRPVHLGPLPAERLGRAATADLAAVAASGLLTPAFAATHFGRAISDFMAALDAVREGTPAQNVAEIPGDAGARAEHLKAAGYFLDSALVGISPIAADHRLDRPHVHPGLATQSFATATGKLRLRFNPTTVVRQMEQAIALATAPIDGHTHAIVFANDYPRDPDPDEPGAAWICDLQPWRAAVRAAETAVVVATYLRILGFSARAHTATTSDVNLAKLAVSAGLALPDAAGAVVNPFVGDRFQLAAVTTTLDLAADAPLRRQTLADRWRAKGAGWWTGAAAPKSAATVVDMANRPYVHSRYPTEKLKRVDQTTTFIDADRIPRVPKSSEFFLRAAFGDLGQPALEASKDGFSVAKAPLAAALRHALNVYSLLQRGSPAPDRAAGYADPAENAAILKATMHFLGADIAGVSDAPDWVWYSHRQDGTEMPVAHPHAVSVMIDQGHETMDGASGDDWISSAQSMRTYMRAALICGVVGQHLRHLGFDATAHSAADSDVIQTPLVLLAGLGEVSRIGETILNPFLGPRLKTGILTTDFPIAPDKPIDFGLQKFCGACNKCARECPSGAITTGPKVMFNGYEIWKADVGKCTQYRTTNLGGAMCGRCMKTCPWNLAGLVKERPFRWAAMHLPWAARWVARADDWLNRGTINPAKKWWWDIANDGTGRIKPAAQTNARQLNKHITVTPGDQTLALYPVELAPQPLPMPDPVDREAGIAAYQRALSPADYRRRLAGGDTAGLVGRAKPPPAVPPVFVAQVVARHRGSADGRIDLFEIARSDGAPLPPFTAGAHVDVTVTPQYVRQFSLAGDPADRGRYLLGVLREDDGRGGSKKIHQMLRPGAAVVVSQPRNHFPVVAAARRHLLLAGGIGVTPLIAMGHELHAAGADFQLYYKARTRAQAAFIAELEAVPWRHRVHFHFSDEHRLDVTDVLTGYRRGDHLYTCGPAAFMDTVFKIAGTHGWPEDSLHREYFSVPDGTAYENHDFELEIASSGRRVPVPADRRATEALAGVGIDIPVKCSDGLCGVCATPYLAGEVEHRDYVLSKAQRADRMILCSSRAAAPGGRITLDL